MTELERRRENLFNLMKENSVAILFSGTAKVASEDETYHLVANRSFFYLTGITQDHSALMLVKGISERKAYLFVDEFSELKEKWTGRRLTYEEASAISDMANVYSTNSFESMVDLALTTTNNQYGAISNLYLDLTPEQKIGDEESIKDYAAKVENKYPHLSIVDVKPLVTTLRMVKSEYEVNQIRDAISLTNLGLNKLIVSLKPGVFEYELADTFEFFGREHNRSELAFDTIVGAGKNGTCLHYPTQNCLVKAGELVLFDLGFKSNGYSADISRTYPVDGVYTGKARDIYEAVLNCNKAVIEYARAGLTIADLQEYAKNFLKEECVRLKLLKPEDDLMRVYFHNVSHHLGLDTHDASDRHKPLEEGNVITVEPGLYFADLGIGVRIEDDVLIHETCAECLSKDIAKEIADVEKLFRTKR